MTPVIRCSAQDHMPGSPRYSVFRFGCAGASSVAVIECGASNVVDGHAGRAGKSGPVAVFGARACEPLDVGKHQLVPGADSPEAVAGPPPGT
ncbi:hypothetical protein NWFMUON74_62040 [Nocardia wallacei]|uniref:Uncharacterized protein n=1 Tax=Nocardia wallacei TaxID=480035 RepID=A0A7G1KTL3_9NOCA|nr:hypothetical protein NWFMUON74_62040 [Nocardia wallacei]